MSNLANVTLNEGRPDNKSKLVTFIRDSENSMLISPSDHPGGRNLGYWTKTVNLESFLFWEQKERYLNVYQARIAAKIEIGSVPICFNHCVSDVSTQVLESDEKNCMRECYLKRITSKGDFGLLINQRLTSDTMKNLKDTFT